MTEKRIGTDEWVTQYQNRLTHDNRLHEIQKRITSWLPQSAWILLATLLVAVVPIVSGQPYILRVMASIVLMVMLGTGLTVVAGYTGLLDLGYMAFYGLGAYAFAYLSSDFTGIHLPIFISLPLIIACTSLIGALLGLVSLRLSGDYLAIATLGFGLIFVQLVAKLNRVYVFWQDEPLNLTGGPNGIVRLDGLNIGFIQVDSLPAIYLVLLIVAVLTILIVHRLNHSPIGRGWRAIYEDELAATTMGIPAQTLKILAFAIGAGIAGLTGTCFALWQGSVFPGSFDITSLIILYSVVVLGGLGSLRGVIVGAVVMVALPEVLRNPILADALFYSSAIMLTLVIVKVRRYIFLPLGIFLIATWFTSHITITDSVIVWGNIAFISLIVLLMLLMRATSPLWRMRLLCIVLPVAGFAWQWRLSLEPGITRFIILGGLLIALMIYRPNGLFGKRRVEVL